MFYKGVKYLSQMLGNLLVSIYDIPFLFISFFHSIFFISFGTISVVRERELEFEIGHPTEVKHVAHIGADGIGNADPPSWVCNNYIAMDV